MTRRSRARGAQATRTLCKLGTLAHNRAFTVRDVQDYGGSSADVALFKRRGWLRKGDARGELYPTKKGWRAIEIACGLRR